MSGSADCERIRCPDPQSTDPTDRQTDGRTTWPLLYSGLSKEEAHDTTTGITTRKTTQQSLRGLNRGGKDQTERRRKNKNRLNHFFVLNRKISKHETHRLNYFFFFLDFLDFVSNKMSYVRIIICIIYNIQGLRRLRKYPLLIILMVDTERVMLEINYTLIAALLSCDKLPFYIRLHFHLDYKFWHSYSTLEIR